MINWYVSKINDRELQELITNQTKISHFANFPDGMLLEYDNISGFVLYVLFSNPTPHEIDWVTSRNKFEISFAEIYGCGIVSLKFGDLEWGDCTFEPRLYSQDLEFPVLDEDKGLSLNIIMVDPLRGGLIRGMRVIGLDHNFSNYLIKWCEKVKNLPFDEKEYDNKIGYIHQNLTTKDIVKRSEKRWKLTR